MDEPERRNITEKEAGRMAYRELSLDGFVHEFKSVSEGPYQRKFCFVLGAGASKTSGIKTGEELVDIWDQELEVRNPAEHAVWKKAQGITEENRCNFYSRYYERRFERDNGKQYRDGYNFLETIMEKARPSSGYVHLALLMSKMPHNIVITTNFDHLVEDSLVQYAQTMPMVIGHEKLAPYALHHSSRPTVIKIHRDLLLDPINRPGELDKLDPAWEGVLDFIFSQYHPVFIGYAGNDNSVMDFLNQHVDKFNSDEWAYPYWMVYGGQKPEGKVQQFLTGTNGYLIRHKGFDQVFVLLCRALNLMPPDEETFLKKAEEQYAVILDSIGKILNEYETLVTGRFSSEDEGPSPDGGSPDGGSPDGGSPDGGSLTDGCSPTDVNFCVNNISSVLSDIYIKSRPKIKSPSAAYINSVILFSDGKYENALAEAKRAVDSEPNNARYHNSFGMILHAMKQYNKAFAEKREAVELEPDNAQYRNSLGVTLHEMKQYDKALVEKSKAVELEPDNAQYHNSLSVTFHEMKWYNEALNEARKAVELEPDNAQYHNSLSVTLSEMKWYDEALNEARKAVELEPYNARYHDSLGTILHELKRYNEALEETQKAIELEPNNAKYHDSLGVTLHEIQRYDEALEETRKAIELEPNNAQYHDSLSATLYRMQRYDEALKESQKAVDLEPDNEIYRKNLEEIKKTIDSQNPQ